MPDATDPVSAQAWVLWLLAGVVVVPVSLSSVPGRLMPWIALGLLIGWYAFGITALAGWSLTTTRASWYGDTVQFSDAGFGIHVGEGVLIGLWPGQAGFWASPVWTTASVLIGLLSLRLIFKGVFGGSASSGSRYGGTNSRAAVRASKNSRDGTSRTSAPLPSTTDWWGTDQLFGGDGNSQTSTPAPPRPSTQPVAVTSPPTVKPPAIELPTQESPAEITPVAAPPAPVPPKTAVTAPKSRIFISYSSRDESRARAFVAELETAGLTCWYAGRDITPGARGYHSRILEAINGSWLVVVLCSRNSVESSHVANELEHATGLKRAMLPVLLEGFDPQELGDLSYFLKRFQMVRLPAPPGTVSRLAAGIADELGINS